MAEFSELVKNFNKIRDFMRDFYIYGFKTRDDFSIKSPRTYDNEKRRCESYLGEAMRWTYASGNKASFVSVDCGKIAANPLFAAWKSKSFTDFDIMLHFYIFDELQNANKSTQELADAISIRSGRTFDQQIVRTKCNEYIDLGFLTREKKGKRCKYKLAEAIIKFDEDLLDAVKFFQSGNLGVIGQFILDNMNTVNDLFLFKHHYIAHTLEDGILYDILNAIHDHKKTAVILVGSKSGKEISNRIVPLKILCSSGSGRRYLCAYNATSGRLATYRLDAIKSVTPIEPDENRDQMQDALYRNIDKIWGVSFDVGSQKETFSFSLHIDEQREQYLIARIRKEGRNGTLERVGDNTFKFTKEVFDANEAMPWIKTFIGRILSFDANDWLTRKLYSDIFRMAKMYGIPVKCESPVPVEDGQACPLVEGATK